MEKLLNLDYAKISTCFTIFYPTASATAKGQRPKFFRAQHSATAEGENCAYGPTLLFGEPIEFQISDGPVLHTGYVVKRC